jgi:hypothetical protein
MTWLGFGFGLGLGLANLALALALALTLTAVDDLEHRGLGLDVLRAQLPPRGEHLARG